MKVLTNVWNWTTCLFWPEVIVLAQVRLQPSHANWCENTHTDKLLMFNTKQRAWHQRSDPSSDVTLELLLVEHYNERSCCVVHFTTTTNNNQQQPATTNDNQRQPATTKKTTTSNKQNNQQQTKQPTTTTSKDQQPATTNNKQNNQQQPTTTTTSKNQQPATANNDQWEIFTESESEYFIDFLCYSCTRWKDMKKSG